ncbi:MAG: carbon monoxide dehydrogenase subunit [Actinoallomurus sp.]|nr:carbon monoxide dehydrogenase subunit [Actinoallomurus sp.]
MKLGSSFVVPAERSRVFAHFLDPDSMRACIPGCSELERTDETHYRGRLVNEIAHVRFSAGFSAEITGLRELEEVRAVLKGEDKRLGSSIRIDAILTVSPDGAASAVSYSLDLAIRGKIGRLGESIVRRRSAEVERQFVDAFTRICAGDEPAPGAPTEPARATRPAGTEPAPAPGGVATATSAPRSAAGPAAKVSWWRRLLDLVRPGSRRS